MYTPTHTLYTTGVNLIMFVSIKMITVRIKNYIVYMDMRCLMIKSSYVTNFSIGHCSLTYGRAARDPSLEFLNLIQPPPPPPRELWCGKCASWLNKYVSIFF